MNVSFVSRLENSEIGVANITIICYDTENTIDNTKGVGKIKNPLFYYCFAERK